MLTFSQLGNYGRIGNQCWQIASTIGLASKHDHMYTFPYWKYNKYFDYKFPENKELVSSQWYVVQHDGTDYREFDFKPYINYDLRGYFQSFLYFEDCKDIIKQMFKFNFETNDTNNRIAVHVRRGDYLNATWLYNILTPENYYNKAMGLFPDAEFSIFSDDIEWCKNNFDNDRCTFVVAPYEAQSIDLDILDMAFMSRHKHHIISNSSFSWWAGYLGEDNGVVIAPQHWYNNGYDEKDICPPDWIRI